MSAMKEMVICIHGGAGVIGKDLDPTPYNEALTRILASVYQFYRSLIIITKTNNSNNKTRNNIYNNRSSASTLTCLDMVEYAVKCLEDEELFNAGRGAVLTADGTHELEASIMNGENLACGAVSLIKTIKNPVSAARAVMEGTSHVYMLGDAAENIALSRGLESVDPSYYTTPKRLQQLMIAQQAEGKTIFNDHDLLGSTSQQELSNTEVQDSVQGMGTVGAVCFLRGHVAAATSTGGMTNKLSGRVGDTPIIGAGTYANDLTCAVSATGHGEEFIRHTAAYNVSARMEIGQETLQEAVNHTVHKRLPPDSGGIICVDKFGNYAMEMNSLGMFRGVCTADGDGLIGIWDELMSVDIV